MDLPIDDRYLIPLEEGHAVTHGWPQETGGRPWGITWHWTATWDLERCSQLLGGPEAERRGIASAHLGVGRNLQEGVHRYIDFEHCSWHAGKNQTLRFDGQPLLDEAWKGSRTTIGVEAVYIGYERPEVPRGDDWRPVDSVNGQQRMWVPPWPREQLDMLVEVGRRILDRWPHIGPRHHHGHYDLCPGYKVDPAGFPFAQRLRRIYDDADIPDVWSSLWTVDQRQRVLAWFGLDPRPADGPTWGTASDAALRRLQRHLGLVVDGMWTTFVNWRLHDEITAQGADLPTVVADTVYKPELHWGR